MSAPPPPPPRRTAPAPTSSSNATPDPAQSTWKDRFKSKSSVWGQKAVVTGVKWSDNIGARVNDIAEKRFGTEHFWPVTGDFVKEIEKCTRILRAFTVEGVVKEEVVDEKDETAGLDKDKGKGKKKVKVLRKIPPNVMKEAYGVAIFTSMRTGIAPFGGAGGAGLVVARLPDGSWSAPSSITPNNLSAGFLLGVDVYDCVLVIRSQEALDSFSSHKVTLGAEIGVAAGPYGAGAAVEAGKEKAPVFSYVKSRGFYAGVEVVGQVFVERFEENGAMYHWPGVKAGDILSGKVKVPREAAELHQALQDAETGRAQAEKGEPLDMLINSNQPSQVDLTQLQEGEVLKLPPTPDMTDGTEYQSDPETEKVRPLSQSGPGAAGQGGGSGFAPVGGLVAPKLPARPGMAKQYSSQSHYSDDQPEYAGTPHEDLPPPGYDAPPSTTTVPAPISAGTNATVSVMDANGYPVDVKKTPEQLEREQHLAGLSEGERREWEEYYKDLDEQSQLNAALEASKLGSEGGGHDQVGAGPSVDKV